MSALEVIGLFFCLFLLWSIVRALFNLIYTCYLGKALGRSVDVKKLGSWAGEFIALVLNFRPSLSLLYHYYYYLSVGQKLYFFIPCWLVSK